MAESLQDWLKKQDTKKGLIGVSSIGQYSSALNSLYKYEAGKEKGDKTQTSGVSVSGNYNTAQELDLGSYSVTSDNFIEDESKKQMYMDISFAGTVPLTVSETQYFGKFDSGNEEFTGGILRGLPNEKACPYANLDKSNEKALKVGVMMDIEGRGQQYLDHFYSECNGLFTAVGGKDSSSLSYLMEKGYLYVEIAIPKSSSDTSGYVIYAQVISKTPKTTTPSNVIYFTPTITCHQNFKNIFSNYLNSQTIDDTAFKWGSAQYSSMDGEISGFTEKAVAEEMTKNPSLTSIQCTPCFTNARVRFWIPPNVVNLKIPNMPEALRNKNYNVDVNTPTLTTGAVAANATIDVNALKDLDVFIDSGHTSDNAREHPRQFTGVDWSQGDYYTIASTLGFNSSTNDSLEHMLNLKIAGAFLDALVAAGLTGFIYDDPKLANNTEINRVYNNSNAVKPKCFVSIHCNAAGTSGWTSLNCSAKGTVGCYLAGRENGKTLSEKITNKITAYRQSNGGPDNRGSHFSEISVGVLSNADPNIPATLIEVCFYDNKDDLLWTCKNLAGIGKAMAEGVKEFLNK